jgi:hypothetical protein
MPMQFPILSFEQANPFMTGASRGADAVKSLMNTPIEMQQAMIANELNKQKQKEQAMYLQKYPEILAQNISKGNLEQNEMKYRSSLMNAQLKDLEQKMKYNPELYSAEAAERRAKAEDITRRNKLIEHLLRGSGPSNVTRGTMDQNGGQTFSSPDAVQRQKQNKEVTSQQPSIPGLTYAQAALLSDQLGLPKPEVREIDGQLIGISAFGNFPIAKGMTAEEKSFKEGLGTSKAKSYDSLVNTYEGISNQNTALDNLINLSINDPEFKNVTGPVGSFLTKWAGTPERRQLLGQLQSSSGEIALQVAPSLKGAFTGRDQTLINTIKANPNSDFPDVFIGKLKAQKLLNSVLQERSEKAAEYMENGYSQLEAIKKATKETPLDKYRLQVEDMVNPVRSMKSKDGKNYYLRADGGWYQ